MLNRLNELKPVEDHFIGPVWNSWEDPILFKTNSSMLLEKILPFYHDAILTEKQRAVLIHMLGQVPTSMTRGLILESRLAGGDDRVDFSLHATRSRGSEFMLAGHPELPDEVEDQLEGLMARSLIWRRLRNFAKPWAQNHPHGGKAKVKLGLEFHHGLHRLVSDLWLEFDASQNAVPEPSVFVGLDDQLQEFIKVKH